MLELMKANSEDAQDHLHAKYLSKGNREGGLRSLGKTLNGHVETIRYANTRRLCIYNMLNNLITMNEGS